MARPPMVRRCRRPQTALSYHMQVTEGARAPEFDLVAQLCRRSPAGVALKMSDSPAEATKSGLGREYTQEACRLTPNGAAQT